MFAALSRYIGGWYLDAYGGVGPHEAMFAHYTTGTRKKTEHLLGPFWDELAAAPPARVLDVGCGYGSVPLFLAHLWPGAEVLACDVSDRYYRCAAAAAEDLGVANIRFKTETAGELDSAGEYDLVMSCNMLNFLNTKEKLIDGVRNICRAARPGGVVAVYTPHFWNRREPFTGVPFLHFLPAALQDRITRKLGKRSTLLDVRNPSVSEIVGAARAEGCRLIEARPADPLRRWRQTHVTLWFRR